MPTHQPSYSLTTTPSSADSPRIRSCGGASGSGSSVAGAASKLRSSTESLRSRSASISAFTAFLCSSSVGARRQCCLSVLHSENEVGGKERGVQPTHTPCKQCSPGRTGCRHSRDSIGSPPPQSCLSPAAESKHFTIRAPMMVLDSSRDLFSRVFDADRAEDVSQILGIDEAATSEENQASECITTGRWLNSSHPVSSRSYALKRSKCATSSSSV